MVEHHPSVMVPAGVGALTHVEPADAVRQHQDRSERGGRHRLGDALSRDPLKAYQKRELTLHRGGEGQGVCRRKSSIAFGDLACPSWTAAYGGLVMMLRQPFRTLRLARKSTPGVPKPQSAMSS